MFLDIGIGMLASHWLDQPLWLGILFSLLPDIDALINLVQYRSLGKQYKHRDLLHLPAAFVGLSMLIYFVNPPIAQLFLLCTLAHFLHDSIGVGWGVQWLWPLNDDHYSFLYLYQPPRKRPLPKKYFYRFSHTDIDALDAEYGDPHWIYNIYLQMHPYAVFELAVFAASIAIVAFT